MRVEYIVPSLNDWGGIQQFAKSQVEPMKDLGIEIDLRNWYDTRGPRRKLLSRLCVNATLARLYEDNILRYSLDATLKGSLTHFWFFQPARERRLGKKVITCHGLEVLQNNLHNYMKFAFQSALDEADAITTPSSFTKQYLVDYHGLSSSKITVIPPGIDLNIYNFGRVPLQNNKPVIGTLTRFVTRKNVDAVIEALSILKSQYAQDFRYILAGDGPLKASILSHLAKVNFEWKYLGQISEEEKIKNFYPSLDIFVLAPLSLPTDIEGFGIVFLEASACGVPVLASSTGGITDAVSPGKSGLFADPISPEDIAAKLYELLRHRNLYRLSARKWAESFSHKETAQKFANLYQQVVTS